MDTDTFFLEAKNNYITVKFGLIWTILPGKYIHLVKKKKKKYMTFSRILCTIPIEGFEVLQVLHKEMKMLFIEQW